MVQKTKNSLPFLCGLSALLFGTALQAAEIDTNMAKMQAMDKITGRVSVIDVPVNGEVKFGSFSIVVRACKTRPPEETPENFAFVDIIDHYDQENPVNIFRGWMMSSSPALNAVEHPIYDVWLLQCYNGNTANLKLLSQDELLLREEIPSLPQEEEEIPLKDEAQTPQTPEADESQSSKQSEETPSPKVTTQQPAAEAALPAAVMTQPSDPVEADGPQALINFEAVSQSPSPQEEAEPTPEVKENTQSQTLEDVVKTVISETEAQTSPAEESPALRQPDVAVKIDLNAKQEQEQEAVPETPQASEAADTQLINFDEEYPVEEDEFELDVEALKPAE